LGDQGSGRSEALKKMIQTGRILKRACLVLAGNFLKLTAIAGSPLVLLIGGLLTAPILRPTAIEIVFILGACLSQGMVFLAAFHSMSGRPLTLSDTFRLGRPRFVPLVGFLLLTALVFEPMLAGLESLAILASDTGAFSMYLYVTALFVAGLTLFSIWSTVFPICVIEEVSLFRSVGRLRALTEGCRLRMILLTLLLAIAGMLSAFITAQVAGALASSLSADGALFAAIGGAIWYAIWWAFVAVALGVAYHDLRVGKRGIGTDQIAEVFE
jgi:hypothetical protein